MTMMSMEKKHPRPGCRAPAPTIANLAAVGKNRREGFPFPTTPIKTAAHGRSGREAAAREINFAAMEFGVVGFNFVAAGRR